MTEKKGLMMEVPIFDQLSPDEQEIVAKRLDVSNLGKGEVLFKEGSLGNTLYYLISGKMEVHKASMDGKQTVLSTFSRGSIIGEQALLELEPRRGATMVAVEDCRLFLLNRNVFDDMVNDYPRVGVAILRGVGRMLSERLRTISGRFADSN